VQIFASLQNPKCSSLAAIMLCVRPSYPNQQNVLTKCPTPLTTCDLRSDTLPLVMTTSATEASHFRQKTMSIRCNASLVGLVIRPTVSLGTVLRAEGRQLKLGGLLRMVFDSPCIKSHDKKGCLLVEHILPSIEASIRLFQRGAGRLNFDAVASLHHLVVSIARRKPHARMIA
jgi:hypothetical protein